MDARGAAEELRTEFRGEKKVKILKFAFCEAAIEYAANRRAERADA